VTSKPNVIDRAVGETFVHKGVLVITVVNEGGCDLPNGVRCVLVHDTETCNKTACGSGRRQDGKSVAFFPRDAYLAARLAGKV